MAVELPDIQLKNVRYDALHNQQQDGSLTLLEHRSSELSTESNHFINLLLRQSLLDDNGILLIDYQHQIPNPQKTKSHTSSLKGYPKSKTA